MHTGVMASWNFKLNPKCCILMQLFEATCVRNLLIVKNLQHGKFQVVPRERRKIVLSVPYILKLMFTLTTQNRVANFCDKHPKSKSCRRLLGWCHSFRAYRLITMEWNVKRIVPCKRWENFLSVTLSLCVNSAFILNTLHADAYRHDSVMKFQTQLKKLHSSATFCCHLLQKLDYC